MTAGSPLDSGHSHIRGLDGLRAVAVLSVFIGHLWPAYVANPIGVDIFFALSGFLITRGLIAQLERDDRIDLQTFYARRALRLIPAQVIVVAATLLVGFLLNLASMGHWVGGDLRAAAFALTYTMNWVRAFDLGHSGWLGHTWSLAIEEQFYLLWPLVLMTAFRLGGLRGTVWCACIIVLLSIALRLYLYHAGASEHRIYNGFDTRTDGLLIGCTLALGRPFRWAGTAGRLWPVPVIVAVAVFGAVPWIGMWTLSGTLVTAATAWLILPLWAGTQPWLASALEFHPVRYLGRISYGLYLWHYPVMMILLELGFPLNAIGTTVLTGAITLGGAVLSFHFAEQPALQLKNRLPTRAARQPEGTAGLDRGQTASRQKLGSIA
jgi:peptidoglycan/LPS O-acetylase OafA/YrhL